MANNKIQTIGEVVSAVPSKIDYMNNTKKNEIYYFGIKPKQPDTLKNFLSKETKKK